MTMWTKSPYRLPFPIDFFVLLPGLLFIIMGSNYVGFASIFLDEFVPRDIPERKFISTLKALEAELVKIQRVGFEEIDRFCIRTKFDVIVFIFKHQHESIALTLVSYVGRTTHATFSTQFNDEALVSTSSLPISNFPRPSTSYLQTLGNIDYYSLLEAHKDAIEIFVDHGYKPIDMFDEPWRSRFLRLERYFIGYIISIPFWTLKALVWSYTKPGKKYQVTLREQLVRQIITIPRLDDWYCSKSNDF
ncbi:MAG: hypothetical protein SFY66_18260 [Oculatellaceae cyanobacterium bins.114]|nr:hypothetical protein [Oculatellaceae cyanobacterium bins.114]